MEKNKWDIELVSNCGLYIQKGEQKILLDALFDANKYFSPPPFKLLEAVKGREEKYSHTPYLIFTHDHVDHFSQEMTEDYVKYNDVEKIFLPPRVSLATGEEKAFHYGEAFDEVYEYRVGEEIELRAYRTKHMPIREKEEIFHYTLELNLSGKKILILADAHPRAYNFKTIEPRAPYDLVFANPLFFNMSSGGNLITDVFKARHIVVYHLPFPEDDQYDLISTTEKTAELFRKRHPDIPVELLYRPEQRVTGIL